jgi:hypothetical protein
MLKKLFATFMLSIFFVVQASAATGDGLRIAFDELHYNLSVEWDQKDPEFYRETLSRFAQELDKLQEAGMSYEEMMAFAKSQVKSKAMAQDIEQLILVVSMNKMSASDAKDLLAETVSKHYVSGAAWSDEASSVVFGLSAVLLFTFFIGYKIKEGEAQRAGRSTKFWDVMDDLFF